MSKVRIGIDVGGTFTHAVAVDNESYSVTGQAKVLTTHHAPEGVAKGIVDSLCTLLDEHHISPDDVTFIAHSTTQATNALLEGDIAPVGILGLGSGLEGSRARTETRVGNIELAPGKHLVTCHRYLDIASGLSDESINQILDELVNEGARTIVAAGAFSVDDPTHELAVMEAAVTRGLPATGTHEISQLYGLKIRTRTAVINASILPKMIQTALMTEESIRAAGITAPLMIMRSDGGVMAVEEVHRRPILTILSGPAAGVAAALMYVRISDGVFLEVGGTSTDISVIRDGKALVKTAEVGGHRLFLRTLDVRTIGVAGGSMPRVTGNSIVDVGPRSAHIAGLPYSVFSNESDLLECAADTIAPTEGDLDDYLVVSNSSGQRYAITNTCSANLLGYVSADDSASGNFRSAEFALTAAGNLLGKSAAQIAREILNTAARKVIPIVRALIQEYSLDKNLVVLVGGGGGASSLVPCIAQELSMEYRLAENAAVISAIGAALALIRDVIERTIINPTDQDVLRIRREARESVVRLGAAPDTVEVHIEIDRQRSILRATATGAMEMRVRDLAKSQVTEEERRAIAARSLGVSAEQVLLAGSTSGLDVFQAFVEERKLFGLLKSRREPIRVLDHNGVVRLQRNHADLHFTTVSNARQSINDMLERHASYGDAGARLPDIVLLAGTRIVSFGGLSSMEQILALADIELQSLTPEEPVAIIASV